MTTNVAIHFQQSVTGGWVVTVTRFNNDAIVCVSRPRHDITMASYQRVAELVRGRIQQKEGFILPWVSLPGSWSYYDYTISVVPELVRILTWYPLSEEDENG